MNVVISGSSGLVGTALVARLRKHDHTVVRLVRGESGGEGKSRWDPYNQQIEKDVIEASDVVVHLSGAGIAGGPWTSSRRKVLKDSRVITSRLLAETMAGCSRGPRAFIQASAIGYYGDRPNEVLTEMSPVGTGFLADLCEAWEAAANPARSVGIRLGFMRTGLVFARGEGFLGKLMLPFKLGMGAVIGSGQQMMSWLTLEDMIEMYRFVIEHESVSGPINCVSPNAVTNEVFTRTLGKTVGRPTFLTVPAAPLRLVLREMADELLLASQNVSPGILQANGYQFKDPMLDQALKSVLG